MLKQLFRTTPKWQSPKSQKRIEALAELDLKNARDSEILLKLAREDSEPAVRRAAIAWLADPDVITQIQKRDLEASVRETATQRLHDILAGKAGALPLPQRLERVQRITAPQTLVHLIREADVMEVRLAAVAQLDDEIYLDDIARNSSIARLRQAAAERITTPALLEALAEATKQKDKNVYKTLRARLDQQNQQEKQERALQEKFETLCSAMEAHARAALNPLYAAKAESLRQQWQDIQGNESNVANVAVVHTERFETAYALALRQISEVQAVEQRKADEAQAREELQECVATLEATLGEYQGQEDFDLPSLSALRKTQHLRWELATQLQPAPEALAKRQSIATQKLDQLEELLLQWQQDRLMVEGTLARLDLAEEEEKRQSLQALHAVQQNYQAYGLPLPALLKALPGQENEAVVTAPVSRAAKNPEKDEQRKQLKTLLDAINSSVEAGNSRDAAKQLRKAQELAREHHLHDARLGELAERVRELKSWAGFAVQPKKEALIEKMQALITHEMDADDKADAIHAMQEEWKALGVADASVEQPLWEKFKAASDTAYEPCRAHFAAQRELRQQNLEKRVALCEQLAAYDAALPENPDWKNHEAILQTARKEWQQYQLCDRQKLRPVQERFNQLLKALESRLHEVQKKHETEKRALIARTQKLLEQEDLRSACDQAKKFQQEWKTIGAAHPKVDHRLWQDFRAASDALFAKRDAEFKARQDAQESSLREAEELIAAMAALAGQENGAVTSAVAEIEDKFRALSLPREKSSSLRDKFQAERQRLEQARRAQQELKLQEKREARLQEWAARASDDSHDTARAQTLLLDLEIALEIPVTPATQEQRRERQMQRLQERGLRKGQEEEKKTLLGELLRTSVAKSELPALTARLQSVLQKMEA